MSFSRANPPGWAVGDKLTSAQINTIDADQANALQAHPFGATDTLESFITVTGTIQANIVGAIQATAANAINSNVANGISIATPQGLVGVADGAIEPGVAGGITSAVLRGIKSSAAGGVSSEASGGIQLNGGTSDYISYVQPRTIVLTQLFFPSALASGFSSNGLGPGVVGAATSVFGQTLPLHRMYNGAINGATLTSAVFTFIVNDSHASGVPASMPAFDIIRQGFASFGGPLPPPQSLFSSAPQRIPTPGSGSAWYASGSMQQFTTTPNQNNQINQELYGYYVLLYDESGANAKAGNNYFAITMTFTNLGNSGPS